MIAEPHGYGPRVHLLGDAWSATALARLGSPDVPHPELMATLRALYARLTQVAVGREFPTVDVEVPTRMAAKHPAAGVWRGRALDPDARTVVVDVVRGGIVPAQVAFELLTAVLPLESVRLDHLNMSRVSDARGRVTGVDLTGSKVGGSIEGSIVVFPDPMGATGSTTRVALEHLREGYGQWTKVVLLPLICTPEFLRTVLAIDERVVVYAARLDRGLSDPDVLATLPGKHWERERGLDDNGYIVPGAGGMGEVINNSWC